MPEGVQQGPVLVGTFFNFGVLLSVVGWCYRTVLHTSVPVSYSIGTKIP